MHIAGEPALYAVVLSVMLVVMSRQLVRALLVAVATIAVVTVPHRGATADHENVIVDDIPVGSDTFQLELVSDDFRTPVGAVAAPYGTSQLFVYDQVGVVTSLPTSATDPTAPEPHTLLDVGPGGANLLVRLKTTGFDERGLIGLAFHPHYRKNGLLYTATSEPLGPTPDFTTLADSDARENDASLSVIREWRVDNPRRLDATVDPSSSRVLLRIEQPQTNHNGGALAFGRDAMLYVALGDGGSRDDQGLGHGPDGEGNGQDLGESNLLGKILRIDPSGVNGRTGAYGIPADNPFVDGAGADEVFAYGFRNPYRMSFDHVTGNLIAADVGQRDIEEVDVVVAGGNYGWPVKEGTFLFNANGRLDRGFSGDNSPGVPADMIDPIAQYDHDEGTSVTAGFMYRGAALPALRGSYIFGDLTIDADLVAGRFFQITVAGELIEIVPTNNDGNRMLITGFGQDTQGELYVLGLQPGGRGGVVYKLVPAS